MWANGNLSREKRGAWVQKTKNQCSMATMGQADVRECAEAAGAKLHPHPLQLHHLHECAPWKIIYLSCTVLWVMMVPLPEE